MDIVKKYRQDKCESALLSPYMSAIDRAMTMSLIAQLQQKLVKCWEEAQERQRFLEGEIQRETQDLQGVSSTQIHRVQAINRRKVEEHALCKRRRFNLARVMGWSRGRSCVVRCL